MKAIFFIPYFGELPSNINVWLKSAEYNKDFTFRIYTNDTTKYNYPHNVQVIYMSFDEFKETIQKRFDFRIRLDSPQKLCDFKPTYGYVFEESIRDYDFWGYCDIDLVLGNLNNFITEGKVSIYEKFFSHGHMTLFKNTTVNNRRFMTNLDGYSSYKEILSSSENYIFDEPSNDTNINLIFIENNVNWYTDYTIADINPFNFLFKRSLYDYLNPHKKGRKVFDEGIEKQVFLWDSGSLVRYYIKDNQLHQEQMRYIHLQKRNMKVCIKDMKTCERILIVPNKFLPFDGDVTKDIVEKYTKDKLIYLHYYKLKLKNLKKKIAKKLSK